MCGIAGFISIKEPDMDVFRVLKNMTNSIIHRGPDDTGDTVVSFNENSGIKYIALGHTRLKIIDLSAGGHQPMANQSKTIYIAYNGEIYNYLELKSELINKGHNFTSASDTEVVLKAYEEWGTDCFNRFNGMWAIVLVDKKRDRVILSRDRFGKKPLYYHLTPNEFIFASEIKALLKHPKVIREPNYEKIYRYISTNYRYIDIDNGSFFKNIYQIPKSSYVEIDGHLNPEVNYYWRIDFNNNNDIADKEAACKFRDLLVDSVRLRLRSDVPVGCMLSGGLDSTSIACIAYKLLHNPIVTFSGITGEEKGVYDESEYIDAVIKETDAKFHYIKPAPAELFNVIDEMLMFHDEPICTVTWHSLYLITKRVRLERTPVILNGHGGDELLAGYWDHYHYNFYDLDKSGQGELLQNEINLWKLNHGRDYSEIDRYRTYIDNLASNKVNEMSRFPDYSSCLNPDFYPQFKKEINWETPRQSYLSRRLYSELMFETVPSTLRAEDRNAMSQSIESRSPWLDYRLVEFCFSLPNKFKIREGLGKWILRECMKGILPESVRTRKDKAGFIAPADVWFRTTNKTQLETLINSPSLKKRNIFKIAKVKEIFTEHLSGTKNHQMFLWQLINLELWFRRFFDA